MAWHNSFPLNKTTNKTFRTRKSCFLCFRLLLLPPSTSLTVIFSHFTSLCLSFYSLQSFVTFPLLFCFSPFLFILWHLFAPSCHLLLFSTPCFRLMSTFVSIFHLVLLLSIFLNSPRILSLLFLLSLHVHVLNHSLNYFYF